MNTTFTVGSGGGGGSADYGTGLSGAEGGGGGGGGAVRLASPTQITIAATGVIRANGERGRGRLQCECYVHFARGRGRRRRWLGRRDLPGGPDDLAGWDGQRGRGWWRGGWRQPHWRRGRSRRSRTHPAFGEHPVVHLDGNVQSAASERLQPVEQRGQHVYRGVSEVDCYAPRAETRGKQTAKAPRAEPSCLTRARGSVHEVRRCEHTQHAGRRARRHFTRQCARVRPCTPQRYGSTVSQSRWRSEQSDVMRTPGESASVNSPARSARCASRARGAFAFLLAAGFSPRCVTLGERCGFRDVSGDQLEKERGNLISVHWSGAEGTACGTHTA